MSDVAAQQVVADREAVRTEVSGLRAGAARMLDLFAYEAGQLLKDGTTPLEGPPIRPYRGVVGKKAGQASVKNAMRRGRG